MKQVILNRIAELGGDISQTTGQSLIDDLQKITFNHLLYFKRPDEEPFYDFYPDFYDKNRELAKNSEQFIKKAIDDYYTPIDNNQTNREQSFWVRQFFTPLTLNTPYYNEWLNYFNEIDLSLFLEQTGGQTPEFLILIESYAHPDHYFICANDINADNPTVFSTDHEVYFDEVKNEGSLLDFLNHFMTKQEVRVCIQEFLDEVENEEDD